ncbi:HAD hydrolase-like protein [Gordonia otitidis]|uniref:Hydrolase n=1 Tax=Gordonia otitidis (strain DSM 44809 / CCUG 52243 / JCM 12355 / NBRC 100426 / IFM 10032) TaxID=1108044 RepID=H5TJ11_GORO1|nr:HAD hydrolase-like protein [Gordonia otitidis]GAB33469.1 putative hydrolase [Gordonia otitidis NBRC 100426]
MTHPADPRDSRTLLLFDLDGTITDSFSGIVNSFRHALAAVDAPEPPDDVVAGVAGPPMIDTLLGLGLDRKTADEAMRAYRARYTDIGWLENSVFPHMHELIDDLAAAGRTMTVATSKNENTARAILEHFGLADRFTAICGASDDGSRRSKADVIAWALRQSGISPSPESGLPDHPVVMIGDRSHDVEGAESFGIPTVFVSWGYARAGEGDAATWRVDSVVDLREVLGV